MDLPPRAAPEAFRRLQEINEGKISGERSSLRVEVVGGGCSGGSTSIFDLVETPEPDDLELTENGQRILVDRMSLPFLVGAVIGFEDGLAAQKFVIENPNAASSCGCGTSFSI